MERALAPHRPPVAAQAAGAAARIRRPVFSTEGVALLAALYFALTCNGAFLGRTMAGRDWSSAATWAFGACMLLLLTAVHALLLLAVLHRRTARPILASLFVVSAVATYFMRGYGVFLARKL